MLTVWECMSGVICNCGILHGHDQLLFCVNIEDLKSSRSYVSCYLEMLDMVSQLAD